MNERAEIQRLQLMIEILQIQNAVFSEILKQIVERIGGPPIVSPTANAFAKQMERKLKAMQPKTLGSMDFQSMAMQAKKTTMPSQLNIPDGLNEDGSPWTK